MSNKIKSLTAIEVLDSRGKPTVRAFVTLDDGSVHSATVPSGASVGKHEALELRDGDASRHQGQGVLKAVENIKTKIADAVAGMDISKPDEIDRKMIALDGTENKSELGANAILAVSMAAMRAAAHANGQKLWQFIHHYYFAHKAPSFPRLMVNLINGGKHANWNFDIQEFIIMTRATVPSHSTRVAAEIFQTLGKEIKKQGLSPLVGDEGGYSPAFTSNEQALDQIVKAAKIAGYTNGEQFEMGLDVAASEFYDNGSYVLKKDNRTVTPDELITYYQEIGQKYNIQSFEDAFEQDDWAPWSKLVAISEKHHFQVVGDDLTVTNPKRIKMGIEKKAANAVIIKLNQIGSVLESVEATKVAQDAGWKIAVSHRSGETEDAFIADFAYGSGADFIKTGSMSRSDRLSKYNRLLEIEAGM